MKQPHKHAELIKAWADGAEIEVCDDFGDWYQTETPSWADGLNYRIKLEPKPEPKPDVISHCAIVLADDGWAYVDNMEHANLRLTFDGETGKLKKAEVSE